MAFETKRIFLHENLVAAVDEVEQWKLVQPTGFKIC